VVSEKFRSSIHSSSFSLYLVVFLEVFIVYFEQTVVLIVMSVEVKYANFLLGGNWQFKFIFP
jgi:hypothetical protein